MVSPFIDKKINICYDTYTLKNLLGFAGGVSLLIPLYFFAIKKSRHSVAAEQRENVIPTQGLITIIL